MAYSEKSMQIADKTAVGPGAAAIKYDILTALLVTSTCADSTTARLTVRLSLLITARYNWRTGRFAVGRVEMARMWGVTERTAKREMAQMKARGWIAVATAAARGRVAQYRINMDILLRETMPHWSAVGPDYVARMTNTPRAVEETNVVPLRATAPVEDNGTGWAVAADLLRAENPALFEAWFARLEAVDIEGGTMTLLAPSRFIANYVRANFNIRLLAAVTSQSPGIRDLNITAVE